MAYLGFHKGGAEFSLATIAYSNQVFQFFSYVKTKFFWTKGSHVPMAPQIRHWVRHAIVSPNQIIIISNINSIILNSCLLWQFIAFHSFYCLQFVKQHYCHLVNELERLSVMVRAKDDLGCVLVNVLHSVGLAKDFIVGVLMDQVKRESMCKVVLDSDIQTWNLFWLFLSFTKSWHNFSVWIGCVGRERGWGRLSPRCQVGGFHAPGIEYPC